MVNPGKLNRRQFLISALMASALRPLPALANTTAPDASEILLNRLTFGATPAARAELGALGVQGWLEDQLSRPARDPDLTARLGAFKLRISYAAEDDGNGFAWGGLDEMRNLTTLDADPASLLPLLDWENPISYSERSRPADEVIAASLTRAVHAPAQLREVMTQFWHDHFNVHAQKDEFVAVFFPSYDATLRENALGNFRALLGIVAKSPSMLIYLNNAESAASPANENFGRELLELHTLGAGHYLNAHYNRWADVPGALDGLAQGYIDQDVYEVARAFTGWTVGDGRFVAEGQQTPRDGRFAYVEAWHDPYQKRVLGVEMGPNRAPMADGEQVLDILSTHPGTARLICTKLARRLVSDDPDPALIARLVTQFLATTEAPDQIAQLIRSIVADPAFATPPTKIRRPFEFLTAIYRASGAKVASPENAFHYQLTRSGWHQHTFPPPTGHPDTLEDWNTGVLLLRYVDYALSAHDDWFGSTTTRLSGQLPDDVATLGQLFKFWAGRMHGPGPDPGSEFFAAMDISPDEPMPSDEAERHDWSATAIALAALSPQFLFR